MSLEIRIQKLSNALERLDEVLKEPETSITRDAAIQRFEFCFELSWKAAKAYMLEQGIECASPKSCIREAFKQSLIQDEAVWLGMIGDRNLTSHTYDEETAISIYEQLPMYLKHMQTLLKAMV